MRNRTINQYIYTYTDKNGNERPDLGLIIGELEEQLNKIGHDYRIVLYASEEEKLKGRKS